MSSRTIFIFLVLILAVAFIFFFNNFFDYSNTLSKSITRDVVNSASNPPINSNSLIKKCTESFNECRKISEQKYEIPIKLIKTEAFNNPKEAQDFFNTWSGLDQLMGFEYYDDGNYPKVLIAIKVTRSSDFYVSSETVPYVIFCDYSGELVRKSKDALDC